MNRTTSCIALCSMLVFSSCQTIRSSPSSPIKDFSFKSERSDFLDSGKIIDKTVLFSKKSAIKDIEVSGVSLSGPFDTVDILGTTYQTINWVGSFKYDGLQQKYKLLYHNSYSDSDLYPTTVKNITFSDLPGHLSLSCNDFSYGKMIKSTDMPWVIASANINGKILKVICTNMYYRDGKQPSQMDSVYIVNWERQRFQLVDDNNVVYADSDIDSYRIFMTSPEVTKGDLKNILGMVWVIQRICYVK